MHNSDQSGALLKYTVNALKASKRIKSFPHRRRLVHILMAVLLVWKLEAPRVNGIIKTGIMLWSSKTCGELIHDSCINISRKVTMSTLKYLYKLKRRKYCLFSDNLFFLETHRNMLNAYVGRIKGMGEKT